MLLYCFRKVVCVFAFLLTVVVPVYAQKTDLVSPVIVINLPSHSLELYSDNTVVKEYPVAIGKPATPTPLGNFSIINMEINPTWVPPGRGEVVPSGPDNPLGYRWMGFLPLYGIHGTNAPWAIGLAVSNGCIRMQEADAEELFGIVQYGTPVIVTYDRIKVRIDELGQASIGVYPDIYGYHEVTVAEVYNQLAGYGLSGFVNEKFLQKVIQEERDKQIVFAQFFRVKVNGNMLPDRGVLLEGVRYIPVWSAIGALQNTILWDESTQMLRSEKRTVPGVSKGGSIYASLENIQLLMGGQQIWSPEDNCLLIDSVTMFLNGKIVTSDVQTLDGVLAVPALRLAEALGQKANWDIAQKTLTMQGKKIPVGLIDNQPYVPITKINEYYEAYVYWNQQEHKIELTYPIK
jgi:hypothetical protein